MNYDDDEEEEVKDPDADLPPFRLRHNDMRIDLVKLIVRSTLFAIQRQSSLLSRKVVSLSPGFKKISASSCSSICERTRWTLGPEKASGSVSSARTWRPRSTTTCTC